MKRENTGGVFPIACLLAAVALGAAAPDAAAECSHCEHLFVCCGGQGEIACLLGSGCSTCAPGLEYRSGSATCEPPCTFCEHGGVCCGGQGQIACLAGSSCDTCGPGLHYLSGSATCEPPCTFCEHGGVCCGGQGQIACLAGSGCDGCAPGLRYQISTATCEPFDSSCGYCQSTFGHCCGDTGEVSCAGTGEMASGGDCNFSCRLGACFDHSTAHCEECCSRDDGLYFVDGPAGGACGESYERVCAVLPSCDDDHAFDVDQNRFDGTDLCQPTWRAPGTSVPETGYDFTFLVAGDLHVGDIGRSFCSPESAWAVMTRMVNTVGSSGLKWPATQSGSQFLFSKHGHPIGDPLAIVLTGDMTHRGGDSDLVSFSPERRALQDYWDERRGRDDDCTDGIDDQTSVNFTVYPGLGNHDRIECGKEERTWDQEIIDFFSTEEWWLDNLVCPLREVTKNGIMKDYITERMKDRAGVHFDDDTRNYAWDWGPFHLVQGNTWAGDNDDLAWLTEDLATHVGTSGRPVILFQHYGWDNFSIGADGGTEWWTGAERDSLEAALDQYNVIAIFTGHRHAPDFIPASDQRGPGVDVYTTDDGGDDDECGTSWVPGECSIQSDCNPRGGTANTCTSGKCVCTDDAGCDDGNAGTTDTCSAGVCEYGDAGNGEIKGDGGIMVVRLVAESACQARLEIAQMQWTEDDADAGTMTLLAPGTGSPTRSVVLNTCNLPPDAKCADRTVTADAACTAAASVDDGSSDPDGAPPTCTPVPAGPYPLGTTAVTLTCTDAQGASDSCTAKVTVTDETEPIITCPADQTLECTGAGLAPATYAPAATDNCAAAPPVTCSTPSGASFPLGTTTVTCSASDGSGNTAACDLDVTVEDTLAPVIAGITANPVVLLPVQKQMVPVTIVPAVTDACDPSPVCALTGITANEGTAVDREITGPLTANLRAKRSGPRHERTYTLDLRCADARGHVTTGVTEVRVPNGRLR